MFSPNWLVAWSKTIVGNDVKKIELSAEYVEGGGSEGQTEIRARGADAKSVGVVDAAVVLRV